MYDVAKGIKVVEVAMFAFVPAAGAVLADWGADVVKVVHPLYGDPMRGAPVGDLPAKDVGISFMWEILNRGKRCIGVDLATPDGREILRDLVAEADVFITNFLPDARGRLGIEMEDIRAINPDIVYARGSGQGARGPERGSPGFDHTSFWARGGIGHAASMVTGDFIQQPGPAFGDVQSGFALAAGVVGALLKRERTDVPSVVDVSLLSTAMWSFAPSVVASELYDVDTIPRAAHKNLPNPMVASYDTSDGRQVYIAGLVLGKGWKEFCEAIDRLDLADDERFTGGPQRPEHRHACMAELDAIFASRPLADWRTILGSLDTAWAVVQTAHELHEDRQVLANGYLIEVESAAGTTFPLVGTPVQFDEAPSPLVRAPDHGEHTEEVLLAIGRTWEEIGRLKDTGAVT